MTDERNDLAAEYALGILSGDELAQARALADGDASFRADVARWRGRLAPLLDEVEPATPPRDLWLAIDKRIERSSTAGNVIELRRGMRRWRATAGAMSAIAASLALVLLVRPGPSPVPAPNPPAPAVRPVTAPLVAALGDPKEGTKVVASWDAASQQLVLVVSGHLAADPHRSHELWVIPAGGKPRSLGTLSSNKQMHVQLANALADLLQQGATIAISVEPAGGSPTGAPTGPVVASGALTPA